MKFTRLAATLAAAMLCAPQAQAQIEIQWWHSMGGQLGEALNELANKFNAEQKDYKIVTSYRGSYPESMTAAIAAFRAGQAPHILQVFEVGTATMMAAKGAIKPVYQLMKEQGEPFDPKAYLPTVTGYYSDPQGNMLSLPFNSSTALFYIDRNKFKQAGLPPVPPKTWKELVAAAEKMKAAGQNCVYTTGWPSWVHVENFSAWHNLPIGTKQNGMAGLDTQFTINSPVHVKHIEMLADMAKRGLFTYAGRTNQADSRFAAGECAMATISAGALGNIIKTGKTDWQISVLPYHDDVKGAPQNSVIGGASLWVMSGRKPEEYKGVAKFMSFLSRSEVQMDWHVKTGYVPITLAAFDMTRKSGFYDKNPGRDMAVRQLTNKSPTENSKGLRFGNFVQGRTVIEEELEAAFAGRKSAKAALDDAVRRGNEILRQFEAANK
ncbi:MAG TPA: sn-glycerol-3-phosphate ABC transporter substrate-binding protein UgpB [Burkholderiales bacterium]|jgi:sn-glycerol 3-phosphate transport system substrate-binding protein|nr:sn-glycerol-3-phosphate ABC transporter substrate-binding protein UgpB [Burkholderiales bacterium]